MHYSLIRRPHWAALLVVAGLTPAFAAVITVDDDGPADFGGLGSQTTALAIIIDHNSVNVSTIPDQLLKPAASLRVLFRHASVGQGIDWGLNCLAGKLPTNSDCSGFPPGKFDRTNWVFGLRAGDWKAKMNDLVTQTATRTAEFDVFMMKFCYIDALGDSSPDWEYCRSRMEQLERDYPDKKFVWWTIPLTRDGMPGTDRFNALVRAYCKTNNKILFDIADIECYDLDGTKLTNINGNEVISQNYTKEIHAGHLNPTGRIRVASAFWHLLTRLAAPPPAPGLIQPAIDSAQDGDTIIIKPGRYTGPGNRDIDFKGQAITIRSTDPNDPNIVAATVIDCAGSETEPHCGFYFHSCETSDSLVDGLTITGGSGWRKPFGEYLWLVGGAIYCEDSGPTISNCVLTRNKATQGAGIFAGPRSSPRILRCTVTENRKIRAGGGGVYFWDASQVIVSRCIISANDGRGVYCWDTPVAKIVNCTVSGNQMSGIEIAGSGSFAVSNCTISGNQGSGIAAFVSPAGTLALSNCLVAGNKSVVGGGGMRIFAHKDSRVTVANCTVTENQAPTGGGISCSSTGTALISESIVWNNNGGDIYLANFAPIPADGPLEVPSKLALSYCCVGDMTVQKDSVLGDPALILGNGNIQTDPSFTMPGYWDPNGTPGDPNDDFWLVGDYHLSSQGGRWNPKTQRWVTDRVTSPCIDAGDPLSPIGLEPFPNGGRINMGAYGGTAEASKSYFGEPPCETIIAGDINGDCKVDFADFEIIAFHWLEQSSL